MGVGTVGLDAVNVGQHRRQQRAMLIADRRQTAMSRTSATGKIPDRHNRLEEDVAEHDAAVALSPRSDVSLALRPFFNAALRPGKAAILSAAAPLTP
jgi:hypothetical protein